MDKICQQKVIGMRDKFLYNSFVEIAELVSLYILHIEHYFYSISWYNYYGMTADLFFHDDELCDAY